MKRVFSLLLCLILALIMLAACNPVDPDDGP